MDTDLFWIFFYAFVAGLNIYNATIAYKDERYRWFAATLTAAIAMILVLNNRLS